MGATDNAPHSLVAGEVIAAMVKRALRTPPGCFVEVGVYQGGSAYHLARAALDQQRPLYLYDTFFGIPYKAPIDSHQVGDFKDTSVARVRELIPSARVVEGIFPFCAVPMGPVAFVHLDCDQHKSYTDALAYFETRMVPGGAIWCDDVGCLAGADAAVTQFLERTGRKAERLEKTVVLF